MKNRGRSAAIALVALVFAAACGGGADAEEATETTTTSTSSTTTTTTEAPEPVAPLTGLPIDDEDILDEPAMVVKISNNNTSRGLIGIDHADVVFEERIEAEFTRFFTIFHSDLPEEAGPIRSGRSSDIDLLANLDDPILVYSGANPSVTGQLRGAEANDEVVLVVDNATGVDLYRDSDFNKPDNLFTDLAAVQEKYGDEAGSAVAVFEYADDDTEREGGVPDDGITIVGGNDVGWVYLDGEGYVRVQDGEIHATRDGDPIVVDNFILMETAYDPSPFAPGSVDAITVGSGKAIVFIDGEYFEGTWERDDRTDGYTFLDADGEEILLEPGQTWVSMAPAFSWGLGVSDEIAEAAVADES